MKRNNAILLILFSLLLTTYFSKAQESVEVQLQKGRISGTQNKEKGLNEFFGIPFAQAPVGDLRWKAPQALEKWEGVKETKAFGPAPVQANVFGDMRFRGDGQSEDCLYLNVWAPTAVKGRKLPVLVYFYGGGFVAGDGSEPRYDGASMAQKGMVTVTTNYRLNIFGFLAHPELSAEASYGASGNYGLLDQVAALQWVKDNIAVFGGDPNQVTIAGESAGSISVSAQMASPLAKDLIAGAIGESGAAIEPTLAPTSLEEGEEIGKKFAESIGASSLADLRAMATDSIFEYYRKSGRFGFPSVIDDYFLPKSLPEIFTAGEQAKVPLLLGWNSAEIPGMAFMQGMPYTGENYVQKVKEAFPERYEEVLKLYPYTSEKEIEKSATALASDRFIAYSTWRWFDLHRQNSDQPVYRYLYSKLRPPLNDKTKEVGLAGGTKEKASDTPALPQPIGAPHACEIEYCMGNLDLIYEHAWTEEDYQVSRTMQQYFANFIIHGDPNGKGLPEWPSAQGTGPMPPVMVLNVHSKAENASMDKRYEFLERFYDKK